MLPSLEMSRGGWGALSPEPELEVEQLTLHHQPEIFPLSVFQKL